MALPNDDENLNPEPAIKSPADTVQTPPSQVGGFRSGVGNAINGLMGRRVVEDQPVKDNVKDKVKEEAADAVKKEAKQVAKAAARKIATQVAAWGARAIAAATSEVWLPIVLILLAIGAVIIIIAIVVSLAQSGNFGSSFHIDSSANTQLTALANAGDVFARRTIDASDIPAILAAMTDVEKQANAKTPKEQAALDIAASIRTKLATFSSSDSKVDQQTLKDVGDLLQQLSAMGYGGVAAGDIGKKIASLARYYAADPAGIQKFQTCAVGDKTSCSGFVIRLIRDLNLDPSYGGTAYDQYLYTQKRTDCYDAFKAVKEKLAVGDILYSDYKNDNGYGHAAIYLGNGEVAAASLNDHPPQVYKWNPGRLNSAARFKNGPCQAKS